MSTKVSIIWAAALLIVAFGIGIGVGRSAKEMFPTARTTKAKARHDSAMDSKLASCREELVAQSKPRSTASAFVPVPEDAKSATVEPVVKVEALEHELRQCKKTDMVFNADMCTAANRYFFLLLVGLHADKACIDRFGVGDLILKHTEQCAKFEDQTDPKDMDIAELSDAERSTIHDAQSYGRWNEHRVLAGDHKANLARHFKRTYRECHTKFGLSDE